MEYENSKWNQFFFRCTNTFLWFVWFWRRINKQSSVLFLIKPTLPTSMYIGGVTFWELVLTIAFEFITVDWLNNPSLFKIFGNSSDEPIINIPPNKINMTRRKSVNITVTEGLRTLSISLNNKIYRLDY